MGLRGLRNESGLLWGSSGEQGPPWNLLDHHGPEDLQSQDSLLSSAWGRTVLPVMLRRVMCRPPRLGLLSPSLAWNGLSPRRRNLPEDHFWPPASATPAWLPHPAAFPFPPPRALCSLRLIWVEPVGGPGPGLRF